MLDHKVVEEPCISIEMLTIFHDRCHLCLKAPTEDVWGRFIRIAGSELSNIDSLYDFSILDVNLLKPLFQPDWTVEHNTIAQARTKCPIALPVTGR